MTAAKTSVDLYRAINGTPVENLSKVIEQMGGIEAIIGADDVVMIKPNVQWWNQGAPNLAAFAGFVDLIMNRPGGFQGEVILAENVHRGIRPWESDHSGWKPSFDRNSDMLGINNYNELSAYLKEKYGDRFTTCHLIDVDSGSRRVYGPADGPGYVYCDGTGGVPLLAFDNNATAENHRQVIMTYPIIKSDKGTLVDFKEGVWEKGSYTRQPLRFINFAALNHHSTYCGATSVIKNYLGISDLSGGPDPHNGGMLTEKYHNFHSFPFDKWAPGPQPGMIGAEIGVFLDTIRRADLNITTAQWIGASSRTDPPVVKTKTVLACPDPVALDYHATKYILYPNSKIPFHDPDSPKSPIYQYLKACVDHGGGIIDERQVAVKSYDFKAGRLQKDDQLTVIGRKEWGRNPKAILKYLVMRYGWGF